MTANNQIDSLPGEVWIPISGYEIYYAVSNMGRVKRLARSYESTCRMVHLSEKILKGSNHRGYRMVTLVKSGEEKNFLIHRLVAIAFIPNPDDKPFVNHIDNNRGNPNVSNLEWCTHQENTDHAVSIGVIKGNGGIMKGVPSANRKLTQEQVFEILSFKRGDAPDMAKYFKERFDISKATVTAIRSGVKYKEFYDLFESSLAIPKQ